MNIQELRTQLIIIENTFKKDGPYFNHGITSREISLFFTNLQQARQWSGKLLEAMGSENPYAENDGKRQTITDIVDKNKLFTHHCLNSEMLKKGPIYVIDQVREHLKGWADEIIDFKVESTTSRKDDEIVMTGYNLYINISQARLWLGEELGRIKSHN